jgi:hypothetical protein
LAVALALVIGVITRWPLMGDAEFPRNDGGMFAVMIQEVVDAGFALPTATSYNGANIPFAYPPLGFYLGAVLVRALGVSPVAVLIWLPLLANLASLVAFCFVARAFTRPAASMVMASALFPLLPFTWHWQVMGGGLTRSLGFCLSLWALVPIWTFLGGRGRAAGWSAIVLSSITVLSHPESAVFLGAATLVFILLRGLRAATLAAGLLLAAGVGALTCPWWLTVMVRHGPSVFLRAGGKVEWSLGSVTSMMWFPITVEGNITSILILAVIGLFVELAARRLLLPCLLLATLLVPRLAPRQATIPLALLAGVALGELILPGLRSIALRRRPDEPEGEEGEGRAAALWRRWSRAAGAAGCALLVVHTVALRLAVILAEEATTPFVTREERQALGWVSESTPASASFVVVTSADSWAEDPISEWFPALARRVSLATPQGSEWLARSEYVRRYSLYDNLKRCRAADAACLLGCLGGVPAAPTYVLISKVPRGSNGPVQLARSIAASRSFSRVFENPGAVVFRLHHRTGPGTGS